MPEAVIVSAARTPVGKIRGAFGSVEVDKLAGFAIREAVRKAGIDPAEIEEVFYGNCRNTDLKTPARSAALAGGIPLEIPALTVERGCSSALSAIAVACDMVRAGEGKIYLAGGMESTSTAPFLMERGNSTPVAPPKWLTGRMLPTGMEDLSMGLTAEKVAVQYRISKDDCDAFSVISHQRAARAWENGYFDDQIAEVTVNTGKGGSIIVKKDETVRADTSMESLAKLKLSFDKNGVCTAGNSSPLTDGASAVIVMEKELAKSRGLEILAVFKGFTAAGLDPTIMGMGPVFSTNKLLKKLGMNLKDIDLIEINEAFASQAVACVRELGMDMEKVNVNGGAIALGHPFGATGGILTTKLLYEMKRRNAQTGLVTFCIGGGQGASAIFTRE